MLLKNLELKKYTGKVNIPLVKTTLSIVSLTYCSYYLIIMICNEFISPSWDFLIFQNFPTKDDFCFEALNTPPWLVAKKIKRGGGLRTSSTVI